MRPIIPQNELKQLGILGGLVTATALLSLILWFTFQVSATTTYPEATNANSSSYSLEALQEQYENNLARGENEKISLYALARIYYISGQSDKSLDAIAAYKKKYPDEKRIYYISGLANAYAGDLVTAEKEFITFIDSGLSTWPGYLDLAWVYFQQGEFDDAEFTLAKAVEMFGDNVWLNTSRGAVALAKGNNDAAVEYLLRAKDQVADLTVAEWQKNYSLNNPENFADQIAQMRSVIETNLAYARGDEQPTAAAVAINAPFADASPLGTTKGLAVSACGDSCTVSSCVSPANVCGQVSTGTQNSCTGTCSAAVPANPSGSCSVATACGTATGYIGCNGQCNVTQYPSCKSVENPNGDGQIEWITLDQNGGTLGAADITTNISAEPSLVSPGNATVIRWFSTETTACEVTSSSNGDVWTGTFGEELSSPILEQTTYTLACTAFDNSTAVDTTVVNIVPQWQEF